MNINLEKVFKKVFQYSIHDKDGVKAYRVVIPVLSHPRLANSFHLYFEGKPVNPEKFGLFLYRGHYYFLETDFPDFKGDKTDYEAVRKYLMDYYGCFKMAKDNGHGGDTTFGVYFREVLKTDGAQEPSERAGDSVAEEYEPGSEQL